MGARIVELAGLADDDGASADDQDRGDVVAFGHQALTQFDLKILTLEPTIDVGLFEVQRSTNCPPDRRIMLCVSVMPVDA